MRKFSVLIALMIAFAVSSFAAPLLTGVGSPYSVTPTEIGQLYVNTSNASMWKATTLFPSGWVKVAPSAGNGSADAPFQSLRLESALFTPITSPATPTLNMLFVASGTNALTFGVASGSSAVWKTITPQ